MFKLSLFILLFTTYSSQYCFAGSTNSALQGRSRALNQIFDDTAVLNFGETIKSRITQQQQADLAALRNMPDGLREYQETRLLAQRSQRCENHGLEETLPSSINSFCDFDPVKNRCVELNLSNQNILQEASRFAAGQITGTQVLEGLVSARARLIGALNQVYSNNVECQQSTISVITNPDCLNVYEYVFNENLINEYIENRCDTASIDDAINKFLTVMRQTEDGSVSDQLDELKNIYAESRAVEARIAQTLESIQNTIEEWEANNTPREPSAVGVSTDNRTGK